MTDETSAPEPEESGKSRKFLLIALGIIGLVILGGFIASQMGLDKALLRQRIDEFAKSVAENGRREGRDITFTYKDIAITGGLGNRHAVVVEPALSIKPLASERRVVKPEDELILRTSEVAIYPKAVDLSALKISLDKPIDFFGGDDAQKKLLTVQSAAPFDIDLAQTKHDNRTYMAITHQLPSTIDLTYLREQQAEGAEEETPNIVPVYETLKVTSNAGGTIRSEMSQDGSGLGEAQVALSNIVITPSIAPDQAITVAEIKTDWKHTLNEKNHHVITASVHLGDVTAAPEVLPYAPIALTIEASYEGAAPQTAADVASNTAQESSFKLNKFALTSKDANLNATGDFVASGSDVLPVGMASITLTNVPFVLAELRRYQVLGDSESMVNDIATLMTGTKLDELKDATIDISRTRGGSFQIGKTTFEELFAVVLKNSMKHRMEKAMDVPPAEPAAAKPQEKIQVEEGARG